MPNSNEPPEDLLEHEDFEKVKTEEKVETEEKKTEVEEKKTEVKVEEKKVEETAEVEPTVAELTKQLEEERKSKEALALKLVKLDPYALDDEEGQKTETKVETKTETKVETKVEDTGEVDEIFTKELWDDLLEEGSRPKANKAIADRLKKHEAVLEERLLKRLAQTQAQLVSQISQGQRQLDAWFGENKDLADPTRRDLVETIAVGLRQKNPGISGTDALNKAAESVRKQFRLTKAAAPPFSQSGGNNTTTRGTPRKLTKLEEEMNQDRL